MLTDGDRSAARDLVVANLGTMTVGGIRLLYERAELAPAFSFALLVLVAVTEEVLRDAEREGMPGTEALQIFAMRVETRRAPECAVVNRILNDQEKAARRREIARGSVRAV